MKIECHAEVLGIPVPCIKSAAMDAKKDWLSKNPHMNPIDVGFLLEKEDHFMKTCLAVKEEDCI